MFKVLYLNVANNSRDATNGWSLFKRLEKITTLINTHNANIVAFSEAAGPTQDVDGNLITWEDYIISLEST